MSYGDGNVSLNTAYLVQGINLIGTIFINRRYEDLTFIDIAPFCLPIYQPLICILDVTKFTTRCQ